VDFAVDYIVTVSEPIDDGTSDSSSTLGENDIAKLLNDQVTKIVETL
jgi:hypothetical protein